ncbi:M14 family metallopeptidase [Aureisphaera galaxeae]|uniref:M14 family metallopeptidase n=1 Tax=Aureisphaera galaxeae TaxID=1538023 RepID=UPI0023503866|nr:M14 family metallopeptidase [Aureisphaera galaxeae]MDC8006134.1 M14 family metallopeptidase [Aureisphaera galaxeae]
MKKIFVLLLGALLLTNCGSNESPSDFDFTTRFEKTEGTETATYEEVITFYENLSEAYTSVSMYKMGRTDSGEPLHLVTFNPNRSFESEFSDDKRENSILINNGIHPGESDGIDASMMLIRDFANGTLKAPENTIVAVIPVYNIGGALNRNSSSRTNQNGPKEYGFRGNARNYDLNRDFIKADTRNARAFADIFQALDPDLFIDNHVSNGADYQYVLTHLFTQHNKLGGPLGNYLHTSFMPQLEDSLAVKKWDITPYVNVWGRTPESGFSQFMDSPRYSTGYTTLFNTLGMMVETHMLKPYKDRVEGTYELMTSFIAIADNEAEVIKELRKNAKTRFKVGDEYPLNWKVDSSQTTTLSFKGYEGEMVPSEITGADRLKYDRNQPFTKDVTYYNYFTPTTTVTIPEKYIIPKGYWNVVEQLKNNNIKYSKIQKDTTYRVQVYRIKNYESRRSPYEGHYQHYNTEVEMFEEEMQVTKGDYILNTQQPGIRYILETLEPTAPDSFFNWNYFDTILQQKEGFSPYVWEDKALALLAENPDIKAEFEAKKASDESFASNWWAQLDWLHKQSEHYEKSHLRYPIVRVGG